MHQPYTFSLVHPAASHLKFNTIICVVEKLFVPSSGTVLENAADQSSNYCRNPLGKEDMPWCWTGNGADDWGYCWPDTLGYALSHLLKVGLQNNASLMRGLGVGFVQLHYKWLVLQTLAQAYKVD